MTGLMEIPIVKMHKGDELIYKFFAHFCNNNKLTVNLH
jgi:hypothetical protein